MEQSKWKDVTERAEILRAELKKWEKEYSDANNGIKASRDVIRQDPDIAAKYKEYNKIRDAQKHFDTDAQILKQSVPRTKKNKVARDEPAKKETAIQTPLKKRRNPPEDFESFKSPSVARSLFTPSKVSIGPTPQKDGRVLGIFDLLNDSDGQSDTPTNDQEMKFMADETHASRNTTPRKSQIKENHTGLTNKMTSISPGKRRKLNSVSTPSKNHNSKKNISMTPTSVSKFYLTTPSFLRRDSGIQHQTGGMEEEQDLLLSPQTIRVVKKPTIKSLSTILAGLREAQDEDLDKELEALREIEAEEFGLNNSSSLGLREKENLKSNDPQNSLSGPNNLFFDEASSELAPESSDQPKKAFIKKGQKRTTRKIKMKPTPYIKTAHEGNHKVEENTTLESNDKVAAIGNDANNLNSKSLTDFDQVGNFNSDDSQSEYTASEGETRYRRPNQEKKKNNGKTKNPLSHQNFKRLKIRNSGAKGVITRHGSRFRRSRNKK